MRLNKSILIKHNKGYYHFRRPVAHLLHLVSGVDMQLIEDVKIYSRSTFRFIPWYPSSKGGGAITLGNKKWKSITFTENFFSTDQEKYNGRAYGDQLHTWLRLAAHEVGHLAHAQRFGSFIIYLWVFIYQYLLHGHDKAPLEIEAESGRKTYIYFNSYLMKAQGNSISDLLSNNNETNTIKIINQYWSNFQSQE